MILYNCHNNKQKNRSIFILIVILFSDIEGESMSKARDLNEYSYNDDDIERLHKLIKNIMDEYFEILYKYVNNLSNEEIKELADYFLYFTRKYGKGVDSRYVSINKMKKIFKELERI